MQFDSIKDLTQGAEVYMNPLKEEKKGEEEEETIQIYEDQEVFDGFLNEIQNVRFSVEK